MLFYDQLQAQEVIERSLGDALMDGSLEVGETVQGAIRPPTVQLALQFAADSAVSHDNQ